MRSFVIFLIDAPFTLWSIFCCYAKQIKHHGSWLGITTWPAIKHLWSEVISPFVTWSVPSSCENMRSSDSPMLPWLQDLSLIKFFNILSTLLQLLQNAWWVQWRSGLSRLAYDLTCAYPPMLLTLELICKISYSPYQERWMLMPISCVFNHYCEESIVWTITFTCVIYCHCRRSHRTEQIYNVSEFLNGLT